MRVELAGTTGFCDGVKRAVRIALDAAARHGGLRTDGPLVHNSTVVRMLEQHGVLNYADDGNNPAAAGLPLLIRAHGVPPDRRRAWLEQNAELVDATCVHVARNQRLAGDAARAGEIVLIAGDARHAEVEAVAGCAGSDCRVVANVRDVEEFIQEHLRKCIRKRIQEQEREQEEKQGRQTGRGQERTGGIGEAARPVRPVFLLAQTTFDINLFAEMSRTLLHHPRMRGAARATDTICRATHARQEEAHGLARRVDAVVVIGGADSANTRRLAEAVRAEGKQAFVVESADDLLEEELGGFDVVGVTSGASTPDWVIDEAVERIRGMAPEFRGHEI